MKNALKIVAVIIVVGFVGLLMANPSQPTDSSVNGTATDSLSIETINNDVEGGAMFLDVRTPAEHAQGRIAQSTNHPLDAIQGGDLPEASTDTEIYVYCRSGNRSAEAKKLLENAGFTNVVDLGGINDVVRLGGQII